MQVRAKYAESLLERTATITFVPAVNLAATEITATPTRVNANGVSTSVAQITFEDYAGNPIAVNPADLKIRLNGNVVAATARGNGVWEALVPARTSGELVEITATYQNTLVDSKATVEFIPVLNLAATTIIATPLVLYADGIRMLLSRITPVTR